MWRFLRPHITRIVVSFAIGIGAALELDRGHHQELWALPISVAGVLRQLLAAGPRLEALPGARLFAEKIALAYLAFGAGFLPFRLIG
jgi:hypothetical protein